MSNSADWLFFVPAILAVGFMIWVLLKFTQQLAFEEKSKQRPEADSRYLHIVTAAPEKTRTSAQDD